MSRKYSILSTQTSCNLGDDIQAIASKQFLPHVDFLVDRNTHKINSHNQNEQVDIIYNGWFDGRYCHFPPPNNIHPLFVSFHINESDHSFDQTYDVIGGQKIKYKPLITNIDYFKKHEPIGCRDTYTMDLLNKYGIKAYFSGCMTLTLKNKFNTRNDEILIVDSHFLCDNLLTSIIPLQIRKEAVYLTQVVDQNITNEEKMHKAQLFLDRISQAKLVITSRLHTVMPCIALKTPVIFLHNNLNDVRFTGLLKFIKAYTIGDKLDVDIYNYKNPEHPELKPLVDNLKQTVEHWVKTGNIVHPPQYELKASVDIVHHSNILEGNSLFSVCMNRNHHLEKSLPTWISACPDEIVLVDWGSKVPIKPIVDKCRTINNKINIKLITITNVTTWTLTKAFNLAARCTKYKNILKLDCDSLLEENFFSYHYLGQNKVFFSGDWRKARNENEMHLNGVLYLTRENFFKVGGYNELITTYGYDDSDLYIRLESLSKRLLINQEVIKHIEHSNEERSANQNYKYINRIDIELEKNRLLSEMNIWNGNFSSFNIKQNGPKDTEYVGEYLHSMKLSESLETKLMNKAIANIKYVESLKRKKHLFIEAKHGLGNRMRALASAYVIAKATNRKLVVIWIPDFHCDAKFTDLYKWNDIFKDCVLIDHMKNDSNSKDTLCYQIDEHEDRIVYDIAESREKYIDDTCISDIYIVSACVLKNKHTDWDKEADFLRKLELNDNIAKEMALFEEKHKINDAIGVHIRMGQPAKVARYDDTSNYQEDVKVSLAEWRNKSHWNVFTKEMDNILKSNPDQTFFLCCDNEYIYQSILSLNKYNVFYTKKTAYDRSLEQICNAVIDVTLLSKTKYILGSNWSSYTELAQRLSGKQLKLAGVDF